MAYQLRCHVGTVSGRVCQPKRQEHGRGVLAELIDGQTGSEWAGLAVVAGAVVGGAAGLVLGTVVSALAVTEEWHPVNPPAKPMVAVHPTGRFSVGVSIPLRQ